MGFKPLSDEEVLKHQCLLAGSKRGERCIFMLLGQRLGLFESNKCEFRHKVLEYIVKVDCCKINEQYKKEQFDENH